VLSFSEHLEESLNQHYAYKLRKKDDKEYLATFKSASGTVHVFIIVEVFADSPTWGIHFTLDGKSGVSDKGDAFRIFATVSAIVKEWIEKMTDERVEGKPHPIGGISLRVSKLRMDDGSEQKTSFRGRKALYSRFAKQIANGLGKFYTYSVNEYNDQIEIEVKRKLIKLRLEEIELDENYKELVPYIHIDNDLRKQYIKVLKSAGKTINYKELNRLQDLMDKNGEKLRAHAKRLKEKEKK